MSCSRGRRDRVGYQLQLGSSQYLDFTSRPFCPFLAGSGLVPTPESPWWVHCLWPHHNPPPPYAWVTFNLLPPGLCKPHQCLQRDSSLRSLQPLSFRILCWGWGELLGPQQLPWSFCLVFLHHLFFLAASKDQQGEGEGTLTQLQPCMSPGYLLNVFKSHIVRNDAPKLGVRALAL